MQNSCAMHQIILQLEMYINNKMLEKPLKGARENI